MRALSELVTQVTGKRVDFASGWAQEEDVIYVPPGDEEGLVHELLHWVVATDDERTWPNLALDPEAPAINDELPVGERLPYIDVVTRERQTCELTRRVYAYRGWALPRDSACNNENGLREWEIPWLDERLQQHGGEAFLQRIAASLTTGQAYTGALPKELPHEPG